MNGKLINRFVFAIDVRRYTKRDTRRQIDIQAAVGLLSDQAAHQAALDPRLWVRQTTGDGFIAVTEADVDAVRLVGRLPDELNRILTVYNLDRVPEAQIDLRLAIHHGAVVQLDEEHYTGDAYNEVSRLLDSPPVRIALENAAPAHLAAIVSEPVFSSVVRTTFDGLSTASFAKVQAEIAGKGYQKTAYVYVPGMAGDTLKGLVTSTGKDGGGTKPSASARQARNPSGSRGSTTTRIKGDGNSVINAGRDVRGTG